MEELEQRLSQLRSRVQSSYDGLGLSSGRPYIYFIYPPDAEQRMRRLIDEHFTSLASLHCVRLDLLTVTVDALQGEEAEREALLVDKDTSISSVAPLDIADIWQYEVRDQIEQRLEGMPPGTRPLVILEGLAALHPLTNPTAMMERFAEQSIENPVTGRPVPIVLFVPGYLVPHTSRTYHYLTRASAPLLMYRGEDV